MEVNPVGQNGSLTLFWNHSVELEIVNYSDFLIHALVKETECQDECLISGFYGRPETTERHLSWELLSQVNVDNDLPWCVVGNFNEIISQDKKVVGRLRPVKQIEAFKQAMICNELYDLGWRRQKFTWYNRQAGDTFTKERLDMSISDGFR